MGRQKWDDGIEITSDDLTNISKALDRRLLDKLMFYMFGEQESGFFGDGFKVEYSSATEVNVLAGVGIQKTASAAAPDSVNKLAYLAALSAETIEAAHGSNNRVDIIAIKAEMLDDATVSRKYKNAVTDAISTVSTAVRESYSVDIEVVKGVEDGSEAVPSPSSGYITVAEVFVTAITGIASSGAITDTRVPFEPINLKGIGSIRISGSNDKKINEADCDGSALSRSTYDALFAKLGVTWGVGDGSTTFNIPDGRAAALRGVGTPTAYVQNTIISLAQLIDDRTQGHWHRVFINGSGGALARYTVTASDRTATKSSQVGLTAADPITDGTHGTPRVGSETSGKAIGVYFFIKLF